MNGCTLESESIIEFNYFPNARFSSRQLHVKPRVEIEIYRPTS